MDQVREEKAVKNGVVVMKVILEIILEIIQELILVKKMMILKKKKRMKLNYSEINWYIIKNIWKNIIVIFSEIYILLYYVSFFRIEKYLLFN